MKRIKAYATYQGALDGERARDRARRATKQGAFEASFVSFDQTKEGYYPLAAAISRAVFADPEAMERSYHKAYVKVSRKAPECLEVLKLIVKNGSNRQKSIEEMIRNRFKNAMNSAKTIGATTRRKCNTSATAVGSASS